MLSASRTLVLMRHAKAEDAGATDAERDLAPRGLDDAVATGTWLAEQGVRPDHAIVSAARRTVQTWERASHAAGWTLAADVNPALYAAGADSALDLVRSVGDDVATLVVVGHNPTVAYLVQLLDDGDGDVGATTSMLSGFPTGAGAVFAYHGSWSDLAPGTARLVAFHLGRS